MDEQRKDSLTAGADGIIEGRNAVIEALRAGETIDKIYLQKGETDKTLGHIASRARAAGACFLMFSPRLRKGPHSTSRYRAAASALPTLSATASTSTFTVRSPNFSSSTSPAFTS